MVRGMMNTLVATVVASCVLATSVDAQPRGGQDPFHGVWQVNIERSVYPGPRPPADLVTLYQFAPMPNGATRFTLTSMNAAGDLTMQVSVFRVDGRPHPVYTVEGVTNFITNGQPTTMTRSYRQIDATTVEFTVYTDGVAGTPVIRQLLPDGNSYVQRNSNGEGAVLLLERVR